MPKGANGLPGSERPAGRSWPARPARCSSRRAPTARSTTPICRAAPSAGSLPNNTAPTARIAANADLRRRAADRRVRRARVERPATADAHLRVGSRRRRRLRRFDAGRAVAHVHERGHGHRAAARHRSGRPAGTASTTITVGGVPDGHDRHALDQRPPGRSATRSRSPARRATSSGAALPASRLSWTLSLRHCSRTDANVCHTHAIQDYAGVASGSFVAPDHEYPSHLLLSLHGHGPQRPDRHGDGAAGPADGRGRPPQLARWAAGSRSRPRPSRRRSRAR